MTTRRVIVTVGAEGGALTLSRLARDGRWEYLVNVNEAALGETPYDFEGRSDIAEAFTAMDRFPWHRLYPVQLDPDFAETVYAAVEARGGPEAVQRWREILDRHR